MGLGAYLRLRLNTARISASYAERAAGERRVVVVARRLRATKAAYQRRAFFAWDPAEDACNALAPEG